MSDHSPSPRLQVKPEPTVESRRGPVTSSGFDFAYWWDRVGILVVLVVLTALMAAIAPNFATVDICSTSPGRSPSMPSSRRV
ncbi:hypothetical protein [Streptomyces malaysiensis]|uniref:Uncharacterized protein n=1 Tax=Streptomyces malaysiensis subsp. samsunensis TaxID=459658 RepID=A0A9X2M587_STRMQ|nr:hypothetical protein [Streptomyces samsunensis]MCQ8835547.1 hypothetical protein [Streptomyces samsunensis]